MEPKRTEKIQREADAAEAYLLAKRTRDKALNGVTDEILKLWSEVIDAQRYDPPDRNTVYGWLREFGPDEVEYAVRTAARRSNTTRIRGSNGFVAYTTGILKRRKAGER